MNGHNRSDLCWLILKFMRLGRARKRHTMLTRAAICTSGKKF